jgi:FkbM family methyltransferase
MEIELDIGEYIQGNIYYRGYYEPQVGRAIRSLLHRGQDAVDVGANIGCFTLIMADAVGPAGRVHAFEPDPRLVERLSRNIRLNRLENVVTNQVAVSDCSGRAEFFASDEPHNVGLGSLKPRDPDAVGISCLTTSLNEYFRSLYSDRLDSVGLIKMDIEGGEWPALLGASELVARRPALVLEICDLLTSRFGYSSRDFLSWLRSMGYECYLLGRASLEPVGREIGRQGAEIICLSARADIPCM